MIRRTDVPACGADENVGDQRALAAAVDGASGAPRSCDELASDFEYTLGTEDAVRCADAGECTVVPYLGCASIVSPASLAGTAALGAACGGSEDVGDQVREDRAPLVASYCDAVCGFLEKCGPSPGAPSPACLDDCRTRNDDDHARNMRPAYYRYKTECLDATSCADAAAADPSAAASGRAVICNDYASIDPAYPNIDAVAACRATPNACDSTSAVTCDDLTGLTDEARQCALACLTQPTCDAIKDCGRPFVGGLLRPARIANGPGSAAPRCRTSR